MHYSQEETKFLKEAAKMALADADVFDELVEHLGISDSALSEFREKLNKDLYADRDFQAEHNKSLIDDVLTRIKSGELGERDLRSAVDAQEKRISIMWGVEDIMSKAGDKDLTEDQAYDILQNMKHQFDANIGINWEVIDTHIGLIDESSSGPST